MLRRIVVGPEQVRLEQLEERPVPSADTIGDVLPEAFTRSTVTREQSLAIALEPVVTTALRTVARKDADFLGEVLAPTIGAAVRKAVGDAIRAMLQRFNEALERSLSVRSVQWRIEARRTGRSFAEVVLLHTLVYRVEQVFLIHPITGVALLHVAGESSVEDPDQVASMLEALNSFVREAFRPQPSGVHLNQVEVGDMTVWVDRDPCLAVAAVVRGVAPRELSEWLREARERVYLSYRAELERFRSDVAPFAPARPLLEDLLRSGRRAPPRRAHIWLALIAALIGGVAGALIYRAVQHTRLLRAYVDTLRAEPGIIVTSAERDGERVRIAGFRDPLAPAPSDVLERRGLALPELSFTPFLSLDPRIVEARMRARLRPPEEVTLTLRDGTLRAEGVAPRAWIAEARLLALALPGIERFDEQALRAAEAIAEARVEAARAAASALERTVLTFIRGSAELAAGADLGAARARLRALMSAAGVPLCVTVVGHADPTGTARANQRLSEARARRVAEILAAGDARGRAVLRAVGAGILRGARTLEQARSVTFQVDVGAGCPESDEAR